MKKINHLLFDLDGVVTNTASLHRKAWQETFDMFLSSIDVAELFIADDYHDYVDGKSRKEGIISFLASRGLAVDSFNSNNSCFKDLDHLSNHKNDLYVDLIKSSSDLLMPGFLDFINLLDKSIICTVASSSMNAHSLLDICKIRNRFQMVVGGRDLESLRLNSKPSPDIFNYVIQSYSVPLENCMIIEDSISGVVAARGTGCPNVVGFNIKNTQQYDSKLIDAGASFTVYDYEQLLNKMRS